MKITVTGGCGYVGSVLLPKLNDAAEVTVLDLEPPSKHLQAQLGSSFKFYQVDAADLSKVGPLVKDADYIIHLAALVGYPTCNKNPELAKRCNVSTTEALLDAKKSEGKLLFASTCNNYGAQHGMVDETTAVNPTSIYGKTKVAAEQLVLQNKQNIVFRFAAGFGISPHMRHDLIVNDFVSKAAFGIPLSIYEGHFVRQFIHVEDMAGAILHAIQNWSQMAGEIYNVGSAKLEMTKRDMVQEISRLLQFDHKFENSGTDLEKRNYPISFEKMQSVGFSPQFSLDKGLEELVQYYSAEKERRGRAVRHQAQA